MRIKSFRLFSFLIFISIGLNSRPVTASLLPLMSMETQKKIIPLTDGKTIEYFATVTAVGSPGHLENPAVKNQLQKSLGLAHMSLSFPIEGALAVQKNERPLDIEELKKQLNLISPQGNLKSIKVIQESDQSPSGWFVKDNAVIFTMIRFFLNGTAIGATLVYSAGVPLSKAFLMGLLTGTSAGFLQYKVKAFRNWIENHSLVDSIGFTRASYKYEEGIGRFAKETYNGFLNLTEQFGKFGLTEITFNTLTRIAMTFLRIGRLPSDFYGNAKSVLTVATHSTLAQGVGDIALFNDISAQRQFNFWNDSFSDIFRNAGALFISALSTAASAFQLANPGAGGSLSLWFIDLPYGFAAVTAVGIGFYLHSLITRWSS